MKDCMLFIRVTKNQKNILNTLSKASGFLTISGFVRSKILDRVKAETAYSVFEQNKKERRSFYCPNSLWLTISAKTNGICSVSSFIVDAIKSKLDE